MIDDMALLKRTMEQMDAEDPTVAQAAKDRAAQLLGDGKMNFAKLAELIEQRRLLLRPAILARIKRMDQPGMLGDAAFRDTASALRKEGQGFRQIAEAIEGPGIAAPRYENLGRESELFHPLTNGPQVPSRLRALLRVARIVLYPLQHPLRFIVIAVFAFLLFYSLRGVAGLGQQVAGYFDGVATVRQRADTAMSSVSSFVREQILRQSREATAPPTSSTPVPSPSVTAAPTPPALIPSPSATASWPPFATPSASAPPATASAPSANQPASPAAPSLAPAPPSAPAAGPPTPTPRRDARAIPPSKPPANCGTARDDRYSWSRRCAPLDDDRPRASEDVLPELLRRKSRMAGPCTGGVGGCYWGGGRY